MFFADFSWATLANTRTALLSACLVGLGACAGVEYETARDLQPTGSEFNKRLFAGYVGLSGDERAEYDNIDSRGFGGKAAAAAGGENVMPADLAEWRIADEHVEELSTARARLLTGLDGGGRTKVPESAAHAQVMFDCWGQEQEEGHQPDDIARCRGGFYNAVTAMEVAMRPPEPEPVAMVEPEPEPEPVVEAAPEPKPIPTFFVVYFDFDSSGLTEQAQWEIREALSAASKIEGATIAVHGNTDRAGPESYNDWLAQRRAQKVLNAIKAEAGGVGVPVTMESYGERKPAVMTADGVADGRNRRVEILLKE
jgi:outer membrane protein OmpA-like peptidoglycan-associated protein